MLDLLTKSNDICPICKGIGFLRKDVPVGHPDFGKAFVCPHKMGQIGALATDVREASGLGLLRNMTFETFNSEGYGLTPDRQLNLRLAYEHAKTYSRTAKGWLVLKGNYGVGKTHLAAAIANDRLARGEPVLFVVVPDLLDYLRSAYSPNSEISYDDRFESIRSAPFLLLDDLGSQSATPWSQEKLFQLLNHRYNAQLSTVITTNSKLEDLDPRLRSRLNDSNICQIVQITAADYRQKVTSVGEPELSTLSMHQNQHFDNFVLRKDQISNEQYVHLKRCVDGCKRYSESADGWLVLTGDYGSGKTHLAAAIANYRAAQGEHVLFVVVPDLLDYLRATFNPNSSVSFDKRFDEIRSASFLVLDDLGTESATPWAKEKLFQILNYRYVAQLSTVFTTFALKNVEPRLLSRMYDEDLCDIYESIAPRYHGVDIHIGENQESKPKRRAENKRFNK